MIICFYYFNFKSFITDNQEDVLIPYVVCFYKYYVFSLYRFIYRVESEEDFIGSVWNHINHLVSICEYLQVIRMTYLKGKWCMSVQYICNLYFLKFLLKQLYYYLVTCLVDSHLNLVNLINLQLFQCYRLSTLFVNTHFSLFLLYSFLFNKKHSTALSLQPRNILV